jgi:hypothetical protein
MKTIKMPDEYYELFLGIIDAGLQFIEPKRDKFDELELEVFDFCLDRKWEKPFDEDFEKKIKESYCE